MTDRLKARWQTVGLPAEHGSWGLVLEPIVLGLLVAFSWTGAAFGMAAFFSFLAYQPTRILIKAKLDNRPSLREGLARRYALSYIALALLMFAIAISTAGMQVMRPLLYSAPLLAIFILYDLHGPKRSWQAEISSALAFSAVAAVIALASDWALPNALALWVVMAARGIPSIVYVRARLRLDKGKASGLFGVYALQLLALAAVVAMTMADLLPNVVIWVFLLFLIRTTWGLSRYRLAVPAKRLGFMEIAYGVVTVLAVYIGIIIN